MRWFTGFVFHKIAFGLLSVFLPLYIAQIVSEGPLTVWGIMTSAATFLAIPFSFLWGYLCDATRHYRLFILLSFSAITILLYFFSLTTELLLLGVLYAFIVVFETAYEPPKNVLIAETYSHMEWSQGFARYEVWTELGWVVGLLLGFLLGFLELSSSVLLLVCVFFSLMSFLASAVFVTDPALIFERGLVSIEKSVSLVQRGATVLSEAGANTDFGELRQENAFALCVGLVSFSLATSIFFTPMPIFFATNLALKNSVIFMLFLMNSTGCLIGYFLTQRMADNMDAKASVKRITLFRTILVLLPILVGVVPFLVAISLSILVLAIMGFVYAFYSVAVLSLSMEVIPQGRAGLFTALVGIGSAVGCLTGPLIAEHLGFQYMFVASAICFFIGYISFKKFA